MTLRFAGSIASAPIENEPWPSKMGENEIPTFVDFQTPPAETPTYHVRLSAGSITMSEIRPDVSAGPIERSFRPASKPVVSFVLSGGAAGFLFDWAFASGATAIRRRAGRLRIASFRK